MKKVAFFSAVASLLIVMTGCQTPGKLVSEETSPVCPMCKEVTTTGPLKGTVNREMLCPGCSNKFVDEEIHESGGPYTKVHSCKHCGVNVKTCKLCKREQQRD